MLEKSLSGIRVLDLTRLYPGPLCTLMLSDMGADVLKIEAPEGELGRYLPPYQFGSSAAFLQLNRGKRSLTLNLKKEKATEIFRRLLSKTDVLVESFRPGVMKRLKLDYETLRSAYPSLIYCSISGYGQTSPNSQDPGHDINYISLAGILALSETEQGYLIPPVQIADVMGAYQASAAICAALFERSRSGSGQFLDISLLDGALFTMIALASLHFAGVPLQQKSLPLSGSLACYNVYRTKDDRFLAVALLEPKFWQTFCLKMNLSAYVNNQMQSDQQELINVLAEKLGERTLQEWLDFFGSEDFCITSIKDFPETIEDPRVVHRKMLLDISYPSGILKQMKTPFVSETTATSRAPVLGEHNVETLTELGFSTTEIATLKEDGIL
jgi:crotonobetainyl-CoA:carnitine CoA-transferase CaiB-like acyl-CoA transferase